MMTPLNPIGVDAGKLDELIERVAAATEGSHELDAAIADALELWETSWEAEDLHGQPKKIERCDIYSDSIDSALALADRVLPGWKWGIHEHSKIAGYKHAYLVERSPLRPIPVQGEAPTAPLSIILATLRAIKTLSGDSHG